MMSSQLYRPSQVAGTNYSTLLKTEMQPNIIEQIQFNLSTGNYRDLIQQIRNKVQHPGWFSHNRPVISGRQGVMPQDWLDIVLSTNTGQNITLRIRQDNLYLVGYQTQSSPTQCGQWLEFGTQGSNTRLIPGSTFLGFTGDYTALANVGGRSIEGMVVSRENDIGAVNELAQTANRSARARDLALLIMVICEATRFEEISSRFSNVMQSGSRDTVTIEDWMLRLFRAWGDLSGRLIHADAYGDLYFRLPSDSPLGQMIQSALDATRYVGLLLGPLSTKPQRNLAKSFAGGGVNVPRGQPMMEVLSIQIRNYSGIVSGTITVTDGLGPQTLFNGSEYVQSRGTLTLGLLNRAISAWESVSFNCIFTKPCFSGTTSWDIFQTKDDYTDDNNNGIPSLHLANNSTTPSKSEDTTNGFKLKIHCEIFREAWQIIWEVKIVSGDGNDPMNVYGSVNVSYSVGAHNFNVSLFSRSSDDNVVVYVGGYVDPLLRKAMAVPLDVNVYVDVDLWDYIHGFPDRCISRARATFCFGSQNAAKAKNDGSCILKLAGNGNYPVQIAAYYRRMSAD